MQVACKQHSMVNRRRSSSCHCTRRRDYTRRGPASTGDLQRLMFLSALHGRFAPMLLDSQLALPWRFLAMQVAHVDLPNVVAVAFSPKSTYLTTYQRPQPGAGNTEKNLKVRVAFAESSYASLGATGYRVCSRGCVKPVLRGSVEQGSLCRHGLSSHVYAVGLAVEGSESSHAAVSEGLQQGHVAGRLLHRG